MVVVGRCPRAGVQDRVTGVRALEPTLLGALTIRLAFFLSCLLVLPVPTLGQESTPGGEPVEDQAQGVAEMLDQAGLNSTQLADLFSVCPEQMDAPDELICSGAVLKLLASSMVSEAEVVLTYLRKDELADPYEDYLRILVDHALLRAAASLLVIEGCSAKYAEAPESTAAALFDSCLEADADTFVSTPGGLEFPYITGPEEFETQVKEIARKHLASGEFCRSITDESARLSCLANAATTEKLATPRRLHELAADDQRAFTTDPYQDEFKNWIRLQREIYLLVLQACHLQHPTADALDELSVCIGGLNPQ